MAILLSDSYKVINWDLSTKSLDTKYWGKVTDSGRGCKVALLQNGVLSTPSTETMRVNFKKPSGLQIFLDGVISGNYFVFDFTEQVFAEQGEVMAELMLNVGGEWLMSSTFYIQVDQSFTSAIESSEELTALQTALSDVDEVKADIVALENPTFTEASTLANIVSGESNTTLWGKVMKFFNNVGRTTLLQANAFDIGASLTVTRFNAQVYNINGSKYVDFDMILTATNTIAIGATLLTFKSGYRPINDVSITGVRTGAIVTQTNIRTTGVLEYGGANAASITSGQAIYLNGRYSI